MQLKNQITLFQEDLQECEYFSLLPLVYRNLPKCDLLRNYEEDFELVKLDPNQ